MNAPAKGLLKTVSILFIVFGAIATLVSLIAVFGSALLTSVTGALGGILLIVTILLLIVSVLELVLGIVGIGKSGDPSKANYFIVTGIILCAISLVSLVLGLLNGSFQWTGLVGFVLPILYIVGGVQNKNAVATPVQ